MISYRLQVTGYKLKPFIVHGSWITGFLFLATCYLLLITWGCASTEIETRNSDLRTQGGTGPAPTLFWPPPPQPPKIRYLRNISGPADIGIKRSWFRKAVDTILGKEDEEEMILRPYGVFADNDRVYITDPGRHLLHVFDMKEKEYFQIKEAKGEELMSPIGIAVDKAGEIYLSDSMLNRVFVFDKKGRYIRDIGKENVFVRPAGIAIYQDRVYVVDTHNHQVLVFAKKNGELIFRFGKNGIGKGDFNYPTNIFIGKDGLLYITDSMNFRVQIFSNDGNFLSTFGKLGDGTGDFSKPKGIALDSDGHIYVADAHFDNIQIFDRDGNLLLAFGKMGLEKGDMILPAGIFIDEMDRVYVADSYNNRVQVFQYLKEK